MDLSELQARAEIRDIVARYNANADTGRYAPVLELFAADAEIDAFGATHRGPEAIERFFTGIQRNVTTDATAQKVPPYIRHYVSTHTIEMTSPNTAIGYAYWQVVLAGGLDRWGRYNDEYVQVDGRWKFKHRRIRRDENVMVAP